MLTRSLGRRLAWDARQLPLDNSSPTVLLSALTRHFVPTPSSTPSTASSLSYRTYATRSTGTQTVPRGERKPPATSKSAKSAGSTTTKKKPAARKAKKPVKKAAAKKKKKPAAKKKKKPAPKRVKKAPTQLEKQLAKVKQLKSVALLDEPKKKPTSVWQLVFAEAVPGENAQMRAKEKATKYKNLQASEREAYETKAASNAGANAREHRAWLQKHTPDEVRVANNARTQLSRIASQPVPAGRKHQLTRAYHRLRDERVSKRPQTPYSIFFNERLASGDFQGSKMSDAAKEAGTEWKALSDAEKKKYQDTYAAARATYDAQLKELFPTMKRKVKNAASTLSSTAAG